MGGSCWEGGRMGNHNCLKLTSLPRQLASSSLVLRVTDRVLRVRACVRFRASCAHKEAQCQQFRQALRIITGILMLKVCFQPPGFCKWKPNLDGAGPDRVREGDRRADGAAQHRQRAGFSPLQADSRCWSLSDDLETDFVTLRSES
eukprot:1751680-Rhodomonas_salina.2